jgi:cation transporter-like permease
MSPLARDIVIVLIVKAIVLTALWFAFFRAPVARHMTMDPDRVVERIVAPPTQSEPAHAVR